MTISIAFFSSKRYDKESFRSVAPTFKPAPDADEVFDMTFFEQHLDMTTCELASGYDVVCAFVNDDLGEDIIRRLADLKVSMIAMRCAGYNNVNLDVARECGLPVVRVPAYSPNAVAEHVIAMLLTLYRNTHRAYNRVRERNFSIDGLVGHEIFGKTVGIVGTGKIGQITARIFKGFGCTILAYDPYPVKDMEDFATYVTLDELFKQSDIISLHCPLMTGTYHIINKWSISLMKKGVTIVNTSRGGLIDTSAAYDALKTGKVGFLAIDVYEEESDIFFNDLSDRVIDDDMFMCLSTFPNVLITGHMAFLTRRALENIVETTLSNVEEYMYTGSCVNLL